MRAFIALMPSDQFTFDAHGVARTLKTSIPGRFLAIDTYHITLAFIPFLDQVQVRDAQHAIDAACDCVSPICIRCDGLGKFGNQTDATLWLGIRATSELSQLAHLIRDQLSAQDITFDNKPFRPHITLARRARIPQANLGNLAPPADCMAQRIVLFKSELTSEGALYHPLYERMIEQ